MDRCPVAGVDEEAERLGHRPGAGCVRERDVDRPGAAGKAPEESPAGDDVGQVGNLEVVDRIIRLVERVGILEAAERREDRRRRIGEPGTGRHHGVLGRVGARTAREVEDPVRLGHLLGRGRGNDVPAGREDRRVRGVPELAPDDEPLEVLAHRPRVVRDEWRAHDRLETAVPQRLGPPIEREGGRSAGEGDAVAGEVDRPGAEAVGAGVAQDGQGAGGGRVGHLEGEVGRRGVVLIRLEPVGRLVRQVLADPGGDETPVGPAEQDLGQVGVVGPALGAAGDAERDPALVACRHRDDLGVGRLADGVAARGRRRRRTPRAELVPLVRAAVPDVDAEPAGDVLRRERDRRLGCHGGVHRVEVAHRLAEVERLARVGERQPGRPERRQRPALRGRLGRLVECAGDALGEVEGLERRAVELELDDRERRLAAGGGVAEAEHALDDLGVGRPRMREELRQRRPRRRHHVRRGRGRRQLRGPRRGRAHLDRREEEAARQVDLDVVHEAEEPQQVGVLAEHRDHAVEVDRRLRGRLHVVVVRVLRDRERLQERLRLSQVEPRVRRRRRDERAVEGVRVQALELLQRLGLTLEVERDPAVRGRLLVRSLPEQRLDRRVLGARLRVEGVGRDMEIAHVPGGVRVESLPVQALGRVRLDVGLRREERLP